MEIAIDLLIIQLWPIWLFILVVYILLRVFTKDKMTDKEIEMARFNQLPSYMKDDIINAEIEDEEKFQAECERMEKLKNN